MRCALSVCDNKKKNCKMYRRDRVASGSTVSSVVSSFSRKSREAAKENVPSKLPRGPTTPKELYTSRSKDRETVTSTASFSFKSRDHHPSVNGSTGTRSDASSVSSRRESTNSSVSSVDGEPVSPDINQSEPRIVGTVLTVPSGKVSSPKVNLLVYMVHNNICLHNMGSK